MRCAWKVLRLLVTGVAIIVLGAISGCTRTVTVVATASPGSATSASSQSTPGAGSPSSPTTAPNGSGSAAPGEGGSAAPGHGSPEQVVAAALQAALAGDYSQACTYMVPSGQGECDRQVASTPSLTGSYDIVGQVIEGDKALVFVTGNACNGPGDCFGNSDTSMDDANSPSGFDTYYDYYAPGDTGNFSPLSCIKVGNLWYLNASGLFIETYLS
jgi:hypothetical protein